MTTRPGQKTKDKGRTCRQMDLFFLQHHSNTLNNSDWPKAKKSPPEVVALRSPKQLFRPEPGELRKGFHQKRLLENCLPKAYREEGRQGGRSIHVTRYYRDESETVEDQKMRLL